MRSSRSRLVAAIDAHVDAARLRSVADALDLAGLEEPQQQRLHAQAHLADLVHEDRAAVGRFEQAALVAVGVGEAAAHVAEQLRLEQRVGNARAVDRDAAARGARRLRVWIRRATTSLPTPLSPVIRTLASDRAAYSTSCCDQPERRRCGRSGSRTDRLSGQSVRAGQPLARGVCCPGTLTAEQERYWL